jgi:teichoic acid transport system permease protein
MLIAALRYVSGSTAMFAHDVLANARLIARMAGYELRNRYASTAIGALWALIQPVLMILVFWFVATRGLKVSFESETPFVLIMFAGFVPWLLFADALSGATNSITNYSYLVRKLAFPIHILPVVPICASVLVHIVLFLVLLLLLAWYGVYPGVASIMVLYYLAAALLLSLGLGWLLAAANVFSRDVGHALNTGLNVLFWVTPILWPAAHIGGWAKVVLQMNPMYFVVEGYRSALLPERNAFEFGALHLYFWTLTLLVLVVGAAVFRRFESDFADVLR